MVQHGLGEASVRETSPLPEQRLYYVRDETCMRGNDQLFSGTFIPAKFVLAMFHLDFIIPLRLVLPICMLATELDCRSQSGVTSRLCFLSISPDDKINQVGASQLNKYTYTLIPRQFQHTMKNT